MLSPSPCAPVPRAPQGHLGRHGQGGQRPRRFAAVGFLSALPRAAKASRLRAAAVPLELQADFEDVDELRVEAAHTVGAFSVTSTQWPPKKLVTNTSLLDPVKAETTIGRYTGSAPPFEEWPFFEAPSNFCEEFGLEDSDELLKAYKVVNFDEVGLTRALVLAIRWQKANLGRSAGFDRMGMGVLSAFKHTNPIFMRQLQGLATTFTPIALNRSLYLILSSDICFINKYIYILALATTGYNDLQRNVSSAKMTEIELFRPQRAAAPCERRAALGAAARGLPKGRGLRGEHRGGVQSRGARGPRGARHGAHQRRGQRPGHVVVGGRRRPRGAFVGPRLPRGGPKGGGAAAAPGGAKLQADALPGALHGRAKQTNVLEIEARLTF